MDAIYTAIVTSTGGRSGHLESTDGVINLEVRPPVEFGGGESGYTNPEQLFAAGWAACFNSALQMVARRRRLNAEQAEVRATVIIGRDTDGASYKLQGRIDVTLSGMSQEDADRITEEAHQFCPYSKAIRGNVDVELEAHVI